jgi:hypothetical protein
MPLLAPPPRPAVFPALLRPPCSFFTRPFTFTLPLLLALLLAPAARATSVLAPTFAELVAESDSIVRGTVTAVRSETFDSPQGRGIHTFVTLRVERALKGTPGDSVTLRLLGGTVGPRTLRVVGLPSFAVGQRQLVFFAHNGQTLCPLIGAGHGRYHVVTDPATRRDYIARDNTVPLTSTDEIPLPLAGPAVATVTARVKSASAALTLASFETQIADTLDRATPLSQRP